MIDLTGERFYRLEVIAHIGPNKHRNHVWLCGCDCGEAIAATASALRSGHSRSCGCLRSEYRTLKCASLNRTHGKSHCPSYGRTSPTYTTWQAMRARCTNPNHVAFKYYGGRGITICKEWELFSAFLEDMGERPPGKTIDRIDNGRGYCKSNCRWATNREQAANRRRKGTA